MAIEKLLVTSSSPHAHSGVSTSKIMWMVVGALLPAAGWAVYMFGITALVTIFATTAATMVFEAGWQTLRKQPISVRDGSAALTGLLLALNLPPGAPIWICCVGGLIAAVVAKGFFGGLGQNVFNPALTARVFLLIAFPAPMTAWIAPSRSMSGEAVAVDQVTSASPLGLLFEGRGNEAALAEAVGRVEAFSFDYFFGASENGSLGEVSALLLLAGGIFLLLKRIITWEIPVAFLGTMGIFAFIANSIDPTQFAGPMFHISAGGAMIGAFFMATDYVTSPMFPKGKIIFGIGCGLLTMVIRLFCSYPEGVSFAILLMNAGVPLIDKYTKPRKFGLLDLATEKGGAS